MKYSFRSDSGKTIDLSFDEMLEATDGFHTAEDGTVYRRVHGNHVRVRKAERQRENTEIVSDAMGFGQDQLGEMQAHLEHSQCRGIEFVRDKDVPEFIQVKCSSEKAKREYMKQRGYTDHNSKNGSGAMLSAKDLEDARDLVLRNAK